MLRTATAFTDHLKDLHGHNFRDPSYSWAPITQSGLLRRDYPLRTLFRRGPLTRDEMKKKLQTMEALRKDMTKVDQKLQRLAKQKESGPIDLLVIKVTQDQMARQRPMAMEIRGNEARHIKELRDHGRQEAADKLQKALNEVTATYNAVEESYHILIENRKKLLSEGQEASTSKQAQEHPEGIKAIEQGQPRGREKETKSVDAPGTGSRRGRSRERGNQRRRRRSRNPGRPLE